MRRLLTLTLLLAAPSAARARTGRSDTGAETTPARGWRRIPPDSETPARTWAGPRRRRRCRLCAFQTRPRCSSTEPTTSSKSPISTGPRVARSPSPSGTMWRRRMSRNAAPSRSEKGRRKGSCTRTSSRAMLPGWTSGSIGIAEAPPPRPGQRRLLRTPRPVDARGAGLRGQQRRLPGNLSRRRARRLRIRFQRAGRPADRGPSGPVPRAARDLQAQGRS